MPTPKQSETKKEFVQRYMDSAHAKKKYPDSDQRYRVANEVWKDKKK